MNIHPLCIIACSWLFSGLIYLIFAVSKLQAKLLDLRDEVDELKKEIKK